MDQSSNRMVIEALSLTECLALLDGRQVGRVAVVVDGQPTILPVNYRADDGTVVFRTDDGAKVRGAPLARVAFEIDDIDQASHSGWSVVVEGVGQDITDTIDAYSEELRGLPVTPWAPGDKTYWIKIVPTSITGRSLRPHHRTDTGE